MLDTNAQRLKKFLANVELVSEADFERVNKKIPGGGQDIADALVQEGLIDQEKMTKAQAYLSGVPFADLKSQTIPAEVLHLIPEQIARSRRIIAFRRNGNVLEVAMQDPRDLITIEFIKKTNPLLKVLAYVATPEAIKNALRQYEQTLDTEFSQLLGKPFSEALNVKGIIGSLAKNKDLEKTARDLPVVKLMDTLLKHAILQRSSDVHIEPMEKKLIVRFRVDGILHDALALPIEIADGIVARIKVLSNLKLDEHRLPQDGRFKIETDDYQYALRVSVLPVFGGEKIVMRLLAEDTEGLSLEQLGFRKENAKTIMDNLARPVGMILVTGPTGSGKTTTLYSMMEILNTPAVNISTIEDPVEYRMPRINQTQVNPAIGLTFAAGLRALVRQDPNIIMVGEIRDRITARLAINAALTGHLVLSTLHTNSAAGAIPRLIDMGVEPFLIASTVNVILGQRLVRKFHGDKESYRLRREELEHLKTYADFPRIEPLFVAEKLLKPKETLESMTFYRPKASDEAPGGYRGRMSIVETLSVSENIRRLTGRKASTEEITKAAMQEGMRTMFEDGFLKAAQGITSVEEVLRVTGE